MTYEWYSLEGSWSLHTSLASMSRIHLCFFNLIHTLLLFLAHCCSPSSSFPSNSLVISYFLCLFMDPSHFCVLSGAHPSLLLSPSPFLFSSFILFCRDRSYRPFTSSYTVYSCLSCLSHSLAFVLPPGLNPFHVLLIDPHPNYIVVARSFPLLLNILSRSYLVRISHLLADLSLFMLSSDFNPSLSSYNYSYPHSNVTIFRP